MVLYRRNEMSRELFVTGYYEPNQLYFLDQVLKAGNVFVDVGANMGLYSLFAANRVGVHGYIIAIEPSTRDFERLETNVKLNSFRNIKPEHCALSNHAGFAELHIAKERNAGHNTFGTFAYEGVRQERTEHVRLQTLDEMIQQKRLERIDVIKVDVEGSELSVLEGAENTINKFHPILLLELSDMTLAPQGCTSSQVWRFLTGKGYTIFEYDGKTGHPVAAELKQRYESENIIAVYNPSASSVS